MTDINEDLLLWFTNFLIKSRSSVDIPLEFNEDLHKPIIRNLKKRTVYSRFKDNIWGADLANMQLISKFNKDLDFYYMLLIFLVNMLGLLL